MALIWFGSCQHPFKMSYRYECHSIPWLPDVAHELPHVPALLAAYGGSPELQRTAAQVWLGESGSSSAALLHKKPGYGDWRADS